MRTLALLLTLSLLLATKPVSAVWLTPPATVDSAKVSTQSDNVQLLEPFTIPTLNRERTVRLYLPPDYSQASSQQRYPVLYMHDGQNLFDSATAFAGEWGVDETLNLLHAEGWLQLIVVGIDNGGVHRMREYSGWDHPRFGKAEGAEYLAFIRDNVKPYIDSHYRTLAEAQHTGIMGSSMGGLISHYALFNEPGVFGLAGIFSPSYWVADEVYQQTDAAMLSKQVRISMLTGEKEGRDMLANMHKMARQLREQGLPAQQFSLKQVPDAEHNEAFWRSEFADAVLFLYNPTGFYLRRRE